MQRAVDFATVALETHEQRAVNIDHGDVSAWADAKLDTVFQLLAASVV